MERSKNIVSSFSIAGSQVNYGACIIKFQALDHAYLHYKAAALLEQKGGWGLYENSQKKRRCTSIYMALIFRTISSSHLVDHLVERNMQWEKH